MSEVITIETAEMQRREAIDTKPQDRYSGRRKYVWRCLECGSDFGMFSTTREQMAEFLPFMPRAIETRAPWYREPGNIRVLYHRCWTCNFDGERPIPSGFELLTTADVAAWLKFACCQCGSVDGMQAVHRETLAEYETLAEIAPVSWYKEPGNVECFFYTCPYCNHWRIVPDGYAHVNLDDIAAWFNHDPMAPDYEALAAEEPTSQTGDSRESTGI